MQVHKESQLGRSLIELLRTESILSTVRHEIFYLEKDDEDNPQSKIKNEMLHQHNLIEKTMVLKKYVLLFNYKVGCFAFIRIE